MSVLSNFLNQTGRAWRDAAAEREASLTEWREAVARLYGAVRGWVRQSDPDGLLGIEESNVTLFESRLGRYTLPALTISFGPRLVHFVPVARHTAGVVPWANGPATPADGCVAVNTTRDVSADSPNYRLYRAADPAGDRWYVSVDRPPDTELTREVFERMLVGLLK